MCGEALWETHQTKLFSPKLQVKPTLSLSRTNVKNMFFLASGEFPTTVSPRFGPSSYKCKSAYTSFIQFQQLRSFAPTAFIKSCF